VLIIVTVALIVAAGLGVVELLALPFGGTSLPPGVLLGVILDGIVFAILIQLGRRRRNKALANRGGGR
jgi:hypothetical protein